MTVPGRPVCGSGGTDVFPGRTGEEHVRLRSGVQTSWLQVSFCPLVFFFFRYGTGCFLLRNTGTKVTQRRTNENTRSTFTCVPLTPSSSSPARHVRPWPPDHAGVQTGAGQACLLRSGGISSFRGCVGFVSRLRRSHLLGARQGSVAIAGAVVRWLQDNLGIIGSSEEMGWFGRALWFQFSFLVFDWTSVFTGREVGGVRGDVLRLLLRPCLLWAVCALLGAQRQRVRSGPHAPVSDP